MKAHSRCTTQTLDPGTRETVLKCTVLLQLTGIEFIARPQVQNAMSSTRCRALTLIMTNQELQHARRNQ